MSVQTRGRGEQRETRERGRGEQQTEGVRERVGSAQRSTRNTLGGWMMGGREASLGGETSAGEEASPCEKPRLGPPVMALPEPGLAVTEDGWIVRPAR